MNIYTSSELASKTRAVCNDVRSEGCAFITNNGKIDIAMIDLSLFDTINDVVHAYDQWLGQVTIQALRKKNENNPITEAEINQEIAAARAEKRSGGSKRNI